ncbi:hypothetical protein HF394_17315 [Planococcus glaciei]|uniref:Uncharacterized protein n=1 Tax=Planococcus glaciei TaxID=459472 RepID=A0A7H8QE86_9BACL|nr:hypothetical protein [Planococcus glaciei]QDY46553.1 hypothetical protein FK545_18065 [Planococcus glaciei]QKX52189.1 hypothetical protein HF394_17315 [Planococcus glaciei]
MKNDLFFKVVLSRTLICLIVIVDKMTTEAEELNHPEVPVSVESPEDRIIQIAPNKIGIVDEGTVSGWKQLVIFEYKEQSGEYEVSSTIPYEEMFTHPEFNEIPVKSDAYGN